MILTGEATLESLARPNCLHCIKAVVLMFCCFLSSRYSLVCHQVCVLVLAGYFPLFEIVGIFPGFVGSSCFLFLCIYTCL